MVYFKRKNETHITVTKTGAIIKTAPESAVYINPVSGIMKTDAPFYYKEVTGDFVLAAKIKLDFLLEGEEAFLLVMSHEQVWVKEGVCHSGKKTYTIQSSITNGCTDIAYGVQADWKSLWLKLTKKGDVFTMFYSVDGIEFYLVRQAKLSVSELLEVGIGVQSPEWKQETESQDETSKEGIGRNINFEVLLLDQKLTEAAELSELANFFG